MNREMETTFIETIRFTDGVANLLPLHCQRMMRTCREHFGCAAPELNLPLDVVPESFRKGTVKCRVTYGREIRNIEFERYTPRIVRTLRLVEADDIDYHLKYADRSDLNSIRDLRDGADEVIIVRNGLVTDTSYSNIVCRTADRLLTPSAPLLEGVMRRHLLDTHVIHEARISADMLRPDNSLGITEVILINAMLPLGIVPPIPVSDIR